MKLKQKIIYKIMGIEGGYSNHPSDSGGKTRYGITEKVARQYGYKGDMRELPAEFAFEIYDKEFYVPLKIEAIGSVSEKVAHEIMDTGVNCGRRAVGKFLQRCLNALNAEKKWFDLKTDGQIGEKTIDALQVFLKIRKDTKPETILLRMLDALQGVHYITLAEREAKNMAFMRGWVGRRLGGEYGQAV